MGGGSSAAQQTQQAQQQNQLQAEQYAAAQKAQALSQLADYLKANPSPASTWGAISGPTLKSPSSIGGGPAGPQAPKTIGGGSVAAYASPMAQALGNFVPLQARGKR